MSKNSTQETCSCCPAGNGTSSRRGFFAGVAAIVLGALALASPLVVGLVSFLNPLRQKKQAGQFRRVTTLDALPEDGTPRKFPIIADRTDAWTRYKNVPIGSVFLRRVGPNKVVALSVICPHAGCMIGYDAAADDFLCPCHMARFNLEGQRTDENSKSPRNMDTLPGVEIRNETEVWVKYENFRMGIAEKVAVS